jgi:hypothetical protein
MEKESIRVKPKQIIIPTIVIMIIVYGLSQYLEAYEPKYLWNILLAIPISIGFFINAKILNLINYINYFKVLFSTVVLTGLMYVFIYLLIVPYVGGLYVVLIGIPLSLFLYAICIGYLFNLKTFIPFLLNIIYYLIILFCVFLLQDFFSDDSVLILYWPLTLLITLFLPYTIYKNT